MNNAEAKMQQAKQTVASNIHLMEMYLNTEKKLRHKTAMNKSLEWLNKKYSSLVKIFQTELRKRWIDGTLKEEFDMKMYERGYEEVVKQVDERRKELENDSDYIYLGVFWNVIYTIDIYKNLDYDKPRGWSTLKHEKPSCVKKPFWYVTEDVPEDDTIFLHRKYCADEITHEQLVEFLKDVDFDDACNSAGALTLVHGLLPAVSFDRSNLNVSHNAYVSPLLIEDALTEYFIKFDKIKWKSAEAQDLRAIVGKAIDDVLDSLLESINDFNSIKKVVRISKPITLPFKLPEGK